MRRAYLDRSLAMCLLKPSSLPQCVFAMRLRLPNVSSQFVFAYPLCLRNASAPPNARTRACSSVLERTRAYSSVLERTRAYSSVLERTRAYSSVLERTRAYSSVLERTRAYSSVLERTRAYSCVLERTRAYSSVLEHTRAYSSVLERTRAYSSVLERTRAYARVLEVQSPIAAAMGGAAGGRWEVGGAWQHQTAPHRKANPRSKQQATATVPNRTVTPMATDTTRGPQPAAQLKESGGVGGRSHPPPPTCNHNLGLRVLKRSICVLFLLAGLTWKLTCAA